MPAPAVRAANSSPNFGKTAGPAPGGFRLCAREAAFMLRCTVAALEIFLFDLNQSCGRSAFTKVSFWRHAHAAYP
jgi:hypothetical protein